MISPFDESRLGTISYHFSVSSRIAKLPLFIDSKKPMTINYEKIGKNGYLLEPNTLYLVSTYEMLGSSKYSQTIYATRDVGSLGIFIDISANLGNVGSANCWTLEIRVAQPILLYPRQIIGQIVFWELMGNIDSYKGQYNGDKIALPSKLWTEEVLNDKRNNS